MPFSSFRRGQGYPYHGQYLVWMIPSLVSLDAHSPFPAPFSRGALPTGHMTLYMICGTGQGLPPKLSLRGVFGGWWSGEGTGIWKELKRVSKPCLSSSVKWGHGKLPCVLNEKQTGLVGCVAKHSAAGRRYHQAENKLWKGQLHPGSASPWWFGLNADQSVNKYLLSTHQAWGWEAR